MGRKGYRRARTKADGLPEFKRFHNGFIVGRNMQRGGENVIYELHCRTCNRRFYLTLPKHKLPPEDMTCPHKDIIKERYALDVELEEGWVQVARKRHAEIVREKLRHSDKDISLVSFKKFLNYVFDKAAATGMKTVDPTSIAIGQQTQGLVKENIVFKEDAEGIWPDIKKTAIYFKVNSRKA